MTTLKSIAIKILSGELPAIAEGDLAKARINECTGCINFQKFTRQCSLCGCFMDIKSKMLEASCPINKW